MTEQPRFQSPSNGTISLLAEAQRALELETHLPLTGWQQEVVDTLPSSLRCDWRFSASSRNAFDASTKESYFLSTSLKSRMPYGI